MTTNYALGTCNHCSKAHLIIEGCEIDSNLCAVLQLMTGLGVNTVNRLALLSDIPGEGKRYLNDSGTDLTVCGIGLWSNNGVISTTPVGKFLGITNDTAQNGDWVTADRAGVVSVNMTGAPGFGEAVGWDANGNIVPSSSGTMVTPIGISVGATDSAGAETGGCGTHDILLFGEQPAAGAFSGGCGLTATTTDGAIAEIVQLLGYDTVSAITITDGTGTPLADSALGCGTPVAVMTDGTNTAYTTDPVGFAAANPAYSLCDVWVLGPNGASTDADGCAKGICVKKNGNAPIQTSDTPSGSCKTVGWNDSGAVVSDGTHSIAIGALVSASGIGGCGNAVAEIEAGSAGAASTNDDGIEHVTRVRAAGCADDDGIAPDVAVLFTNNSQIPAITAYVPPPIDEWNVPNAMLYRTDKALVLRCSYYANQSHRTHINFGGVAMARMGDPHYILNWNAGGSLERNAYQEFRFAMVDDNCFMVSASFGDTSGNNSYQGLYNLLGSPFILLPPDPSGFTNLMWGLTTGSLAGRAFPFDVDLHFEDRV